jgi:hypothetical protein
MFLPIQFIAARQSYNRPSGQGNEFRVVADAAKGITLKCTASGGLAARLRMFKEGRAEPLQSPGNPQPHYRRKAYSGARREASRDCGKKRQFGA